MKKLVLLAIVFSSLLGFGSPALADEIQSQAQTIHIQGIVPEMRVLYVQNGELIKVGGNTTKNVAPTALDITTNNSTAVTSKLLQQYELFLLVHDNHLAPGYYTVPHIDAASPTGRAMSVSIFKLTV